jgi:CRISPR/Cas system-associated protein Cas7 (RAMP superfamily)
LRHSEGLEKEEEEAIVETDEDAKRVVELLKALKEARNEEGGSGFMLFVEVCA